MGKYEEIYFDDYKILKVPRKGVIHDVLVDKIRSTAIIRGTKARLAREYGVSKSAISAILNNKTWRNA